MPGFGIDKVIFFCPRLDKGIIISLFYGIYGGEKIYTTIDCEHKNLCDIEERRNWQSCPAYKIYIGEHH